MLYEPTIGVYKGRHYQIRFNALKHPCGYVRIEDEDIDILRDLADDDFDTVDEYIDMHEGCTSVSQLLGEKGMWIGFDTSHYFDNEFTRTIEFVQIECKYIIDQLLNLQKENLS